MFLIETGLIYDSDMVDVPRIKQYIQDRDPMIIGALRSCAPAEDGQVVCWGPDKNIICFDPSAPGDTRD